MQPVASERLVDAHHRLGWSIRNEAVHERARPSSAVIGCGAARFRPGTTSMAVRGSACRGAGMMTGLFLCSASSAAGEVGLGVDERGAAHDESFIMVHMRRRQLERGCAA